MYLKKTIIVMTELFNCSILSCAKKPVRATPGSAGYDVFAYNEKVIPKHSVRRICIGVGIEMSPGIHAEFKTRSSYVFKNLSVEAGVIDSDYRGLLYVCIRNHNELDYLVRQDEKIAQLIFYKTVFPDFDVVEKLSETARGEGGFGSTGN